MDRELLDHAARVLYHTPARVLDASTLYDRVRRETGIECGIRLFLDRLQAAAHRFAVLPATADLDPAGAWSEVERMAYASGLAAAGLCRWPLVSLCEVSEPGEAETTGHGSGLAPDQAAIPRSAGPDPADPLREVHRSVAELLRSGGPDPLLRDAVGAAVAALDTAISGRPETARCARDLTADAATGRSTTRPRHLPPPR
ncbi:MAG TPA: hypothetical protein VK929_16365 [Longimicrobiales bacterium]|nr:hypothetical protein [Longimicrobiales bacterium]